MKLIKIEKCSDCPYIIRQYAFKNKPGPLKKKSFCNYNGIHGIKNGRKLLENENTLDPSCPIKDDWDETIYEIEKMDNYVLYKRLKKDERV